MNNTKLQKRRALNITHSRFTVISFQTWQLNNNSSIWFQIQNWLCNAHAVDTVTQNFQCTRRRIFFRIFAQISILNFQDEHRSAAQIKAKLNLILNRRHDCDRRRGQRNQQQPFPKHSLLHLASPKLTTAKSNPISYLHR